MTRLAANIAGLALLALLATPAAAEPARVVRIVDGDTFIADIATGRVTVRVAGLDTPEKRPRAKCEQEAQAGEAATRFAAMMLGGRTVEIDRAPGRDRYGRYLGRVRIDGRDYAGMVIEARLGVRYDGKRKPTWCP